jgi:long-chain acyl-CoA synthetase
MDEMGVTAFARTNPEKPALVDGDRMVTFGELDARMNQVARAIQRRGVDPGDRIASALSNRFEWFEVAGGAARAGVTVVPISWRAMPDEMHYLVEDSGAKLLFVESGTAESVPRLPVISAGPEYEDMVGAEDIGPLSSGAERPVIGFRYYTSGTTGRPKAIEGELPSGPALAALRTMFSPPAQPVRLAPGERRALGRGQTEGLEGPDEVHLLVGPTYHTAPGTFANRALHYGQTVVMMRHFDPAECLRLIEHHGVTWSHMVPINFVRILKLPEAVRRSFDLSSLRRVLHAAAPCPVDVKRAVMNLFPPGTVYEYYGATEGLATVCPADEWLSKPGTVGRAAAGIEVRVYDESGVELAAGAVGTVYFSTVMRFSYAGAPEKTAQSWRGEFFTAGDMGYLDEDGYLFLTDRKIDMIISGGANVYPAEVEGVLIMHPSVADVAVFGVPDAEWGERVHAVVEARMTAPEGDLLAFCRQRLAHYKCPTSIEIVESLPRDPNGKIRKRLLRDRHWAGSEKKI